ncbi:D-glycero-beta-D-manno-heptose 1,7-bisphosphate 7-phosphatase [Candidatus Pseudothioglobus singularis]|jgi:D-glycero-D-manno-heptose 1,7-bisphosphate phosphatase|nr:D-glycero-beta-D-manno-heptose 1,7-bisphosphate 7-phosphatase [Candidatus Pseudothioglobus singularis]
MSIKTIFLDRDGVINKEVRYLFKISNFEFIHGIFDSCLYFQKLGYKIIVITNQSGIARGYYNENDFSHLNDWMLSKFKERKVNILDVFHCPHEPKLGCDCRKPRPGMFLNAQKKYDINMKKSWMIGDKETDIVASNAAGIKKTILVRSGHSIDEINSNSKFIIDSIKDSTEVIVD